MDSDLLCNFCDLLKLKVNDVFHPFYAQSLNLLTVKCMVLILSRLLTVRKRREEMGRKGTHKVVSFASEFGLNFRTYVIGQMG